MTPDNENDLIQELLSYAQAIPKPERRQMSKQLFIDRYLPHFLQNTDGLVKLWTEYSGGPSETVDLLENGQVVLVVPPLVPDMQVPEYNRLRPVSELLDVAWKESQRLPFNTMQIYKHLTDLIIPDEQQQHHERVWLAFFHDLGVDLSTKAPTSPTEPADTPIDESHEPKTIAYRDF